MKVLTYAVYLLFPLQLLFSRQESSENGIDTAKERNRRTVSGGHTDPFPVRGLKKTVSSKK